MAVGRSGGCREPQTDNGSAPWRFQTDNRRGNGAIVAPARVDDEVVEAASVDIVRQCIGAWAASAGGSLDDSKVAAQVPVGGERRYIGDDARVGWGGAGEGCGTERHTAERKKQSTGNTAEVHGLSLRSGSGVRAPNGQQAAAAGSTAAAPAFGNEA